MENEDTRTLTLEIPSAGATKNAPDPIWTAISPATGWVPLASSPLTLSWTGTIDLSGYVREMKTFYPSAAFTQRGPNTLSQGGAGVQTYTIISSIPLDGDEVLGQLTTGAPGFITIGSNQQNWDTVLFAESQLYVVNANIQPNPFGILQLLDTHQSGSLSPTASDTLYCLKLAIPNDVSLTTIQIPASRVILPGKFGTEPDVEYMMRLKRSVELSQQV
mgnify:CR=1 FL=1|tara:strand:- start:285 stop:938 length:654 start_codon:yes stop_codon:yes gene_type:complete